MQNKTYSIVDPEPAGVIVYARPGGYGDVHFVLQSSASFRHIENETKRLLRPSFGEVSSASYQW